MICDVCRKELINPVPEDLRYGAKFCSWKCALRSGRDLTMDGKNLASPAFIDERATGFV